MGVFDLSFLYVAVRSIIALVSAVAVFRYSRAVVYVGLQAVADVFSALFILAYVDAGLRDKLGGWVILMFLYCMGWEGLVLLRRLASFLPFVGEATAEAEASPLSALTDTQALAWTAFAVTPALAAGFFLTLNAFAPGNWLFPGQPLSTVTGPT